MRILVVEDDPLMADAVLRGLTQSGFAVDCVNSAEKGEAAMRSEHFDLLLVDIGLPGMDGLELLRRVRQQGAKLPVLMVTARDALADRVNALDIGGDDYLVKPFAMPELVARCRALMRRSKALSNPQISVGGLRMDLGRREASVNGIEIVLTPREWAVLECLALHAGEVVRKDRLLQAISNWEDDLTFNALEVYISRLRGKLVGAVAIRTARGLGYRLDDAAV